MNEKNILSFLGRKKSFLRSDYNKFNKELKKKINNKKIIVLGGAGSIGAQAVKELLRFKPSKLHVIDVNENGLVELVREVRSSQNKIISNFKTFVLDIGDLEFEGMIKKEKGYDIWMNFVALKHIRSEKDPFTLMHLIKTNILTLNKNLELAKKTNAKRFFSVSTDKAADPINFMGASKAIMEIILKSYSKFFITSSARFGNVAFSNGSLLDNTVKRVQLNQPIVAPIDIRRFFLTAKEAAHISLITTFFANSGKVFIPKLDRKTYENDFIAIMGNYLSHLGYKLVKIKTEKKAKVDVLKLKKQKKWPCYVSYTNTSGEKKAEIFSAASEKVYKTKFPELEQVNIKEKDLSKIKNILSKFNDIRKKKIFSKEKIKNIFSSFLNNFKHYDVGKNLDSKM